MDNKDGIGDAAFAGMVKSTVVGGTVDNALVFTEIQVHRGGTAAVKVEGIAAAEPAQELL